MYNKWVKRTESYVNWAAFCDHYNLIIYFIFLKKNKSASLAIFRGKSNFNLQSTAVNVNHWLNRSWKSQSQFILSTWASCFAVIPQKLSNLEIFLLINDLTLVVLWVQLTEKTNRYRWSKAWISSSLWYLGVVYLNRFWGLNETLYWKCARGNLTTLWRGVHPFQLHWYSICKYTMRQKIEIIPAVDNSSDK